MARVLLFLPFLLATTQSFSAPETLRCGNKIVETGMTMAEVEKYCGKPSTVMVEEQDVRSGNRVVGTTQIHYWTYDRASGQNAAILEFDQEKLLSITFVRK